MPRDSRETPALQIAAPRGTGGRFDNPSICRSYNRVCGAGRRLRRCPRVAGGSLAGPNAWWVPGRSVMGGASMGRGGFSSHGPVGFHGGASFGSAARLGSAPRFGVAFGTGLRQPAFRSGSSFGGFRQPVFGSRHSHHRVFLGSVFPGYYGYYGYPTYYGDSFSSTPDYYPGYDYYGSSYSAPAYSAQNDIAQQQQDIDRLEDEVARLQEQRETPQPEAREAPDFKRKAHRSPRCWSSATSILRKSRTTRLSAARFGFSASSGPPSFRCPGWISRPPPKPTTIAG